MNKYDMTKDKKDTKTDEKGMVEVSAHLKIFDPETKEVIVNKRG